METKGLNSTFKQFKIEERLAHFKNSVTKKKKIFYSTEEKSFLLPYLTQQTCSTLCAKELNNKDYSIPFNHLLNLAGLDCENLVRIFFFPFLVKCLDNNFPISQSS